MIVAVYVVSALNPGFGVNEIVEVPELNETVPGTTAFEGSVTMKFVDVIVVGSIVLLKVAVTGPVSPTFVAKATGTVEVTVGGWMEELE